MPVPRAGERREGGRLSLKRMAALLGVAGGVVAALAGATSLIDWVAERLGGSDPTAVAPEITGIAAQSRQTLADHLRYVHDPLTGRTAAELRQVGYVFAVTMRIRGAQGERFALRWSLSDAETGHRLRGPSFNQEQAVFEPSTQNQTRAYPIWIPEPPPGRYEVTVSLVNEKLEPVEQELAPPLTVR